MQGLGWGLKIAIQVQFCNVFVLSPIVFTLSVTRFGGFLGNGKRGIKEILGIMRSICRPQSAAKHFPCHSESISHKRPQPHPGCSLNNSLFLHVFLLRELF